MSWHFSQALEAAYSEANCSDGERFVPWKSMPIAADDSCSAKMKDTCHRSPFGMMFVPSTDGPGGELLTWFRGGSPARISAPPEPVRGLMENGLDSGWKWPGSWAKYDPATCLWKTRQCSLLGDSDEFSGIWPRWGTMRSGECWERQTWERRTARETEFGLWPTPRATDGDKGTRTAEGAARELARGKNVDLGVFIGGGPVNPQLSEWLMGWPIGWTGCEPLETDKSPSVQPRHGTG